MTNKEAIKIIQMERDHCATHNRDAGMSEEYHKEMQSLVDAFDLAIIALEERPQDNLILLLTELCNGYCKNCPVTDEFANFCADCICTRIRGIIGEVKDE